MPQPALLLPAVPDTRRSLTRRRLGAPNNLARWTVARLGGTVTHEVRRLAVPRAIAHVQSIVCQASPPAALGAVRSPGTEPHGVAVVLRREVRVRPDVEDLPRFASPVLADGTPHHTPFVDLVDPELGRSASLAWALRALRWASSVGARKDTSSADTRPSRPGRGSKQTRSPSPSVRSPERSRAEMWTKTSAAPSSGAMNP